MSRRGGEIATTDVHTRARHCTEREKCAAAADASAPLSDGEVARERALVEYSAALIELFGERLPPEAARHEDWAATDPVACLLPSLLLALLEAPPRTADLLAPPLALLAALRRAGVGGADGAATDAPYDNVAHRRRAGAGLYGVPGARQASTQSQILEPSNYGVAVVGNPTAAPPESPLYAEIGPPGEAFRKSIALEHLREQIRKLGADPEC